LFTGVLAQFIEQFSADNQYLNPQFSSVVNA
jgi:hypothetical protein